ncbi:MAG TPA: protease pro-enzyme activation domain-containing protein [Verrucomicrobiae bacterium]|nr:protease pro-enzyme activation domain-containing protein [Verrucomicrobiae bacterium]
MRTHWRGLLSCFVAALFAFWTPPGWAAPRKTLPGHVPAVVRKVASISRMPAATQLRLSLGLPLHNEQDLTALLHDLYDPSNVRYHQFLTPDQFTQKFGPTEQEYQALIDFVQGNGLTIVGRHQNRLLLDVAGAAADIEKAFATTLRLYPHPSERREFFAPEIEPSVVAGVPLLDISGLDNFIVPHACSLHRQAALPAAAPNLGSGPGGGYLGNDFRAAYLPAVALTGTGQIVGLLEFDGYYTNDITAYEAQAGLPNVPLQTLLFNGFSGTPGADNAEVALDIEVAIAMAPGLSSVMVYEGVGANTMLSRMATDNRAKQLSSSWTFGINATTENIFRQFAAQGQSMFQAAGDDGAYSGTVDPPADNPNLTVVGGTTLSTAGPHGAWTGETTWNWASVGQGSAATGGGVSTTYPIPSYQSGLDMSANQGSTTLRNFPDVALTADNIWVVWNNGSKGYFGGTSAAAPLWAGFMALVNQQSVANGHSTLGFINPALYLIGKGTNYSACFHDIRTGNNTNSTSPSKFSAVNGYDLCTGWGTPAGQRLINALAGGTNLPPVFNANPFLAPSANVGHPATGSIANQASDPNPGERLSFAKLGGPAWLTIAPSGALSGTPSGSDVGTNVFQVSVSEPAGMSNTATMYLNVNAAPAFVADPFVAAPVTVGQTYSNSIVGQANDPNPGTTLTFAKVSGPVWLSVAADGTLSGVPGAGDIGTNTFSVAVTDSGGLSSTATMNLPVMAPPRVNLQASYQSNSFVLTWDAAPASFQVQVCTNLSGNGWQNIGPPTTQSSISLPAIGPSAFYRLVPAGN